MIAKLRAQVIEVLEAAGYRNSEDSLSMYASGGTFSTLGGDTGVSVTCDRWNASSDELAELRTGIVAALRAAGLEAAELDGRLIRYLRLHPSASDAEVCEALGLHPVFDLDEVIRPTRQSPQADLPDSTASSQLGAPSPASRDAADLSG